MALAVFLQVVFLVLQPRSGFSSGVAPVLFHV